jgi:hypothetical protein
MNAKTRKPSTGRLLAFAAALVPLVLGVAVVYRWLRTPDVTIGVEGRKIVEIAGPQLTAAPFTHGDAASVRIDSVQSIPGGYRYDLRYMLFGPGKRNLSDHLLRPDGSPLPTQKDLAVSVDALLPDDYSSELFTTPNSNINLHSYYTPMMRVLWGLWAAMLIPLAWYGHKRRKRLAPPPRAPSVAEQLKALLERASRKTLSVEQQADLEQLLLAFWSKRLNLSQERLIETVAELRKHPQAAGQLNRVERWLHSRAKPSNGAVARELLNDLKSLDN